MRRLWNKYVGSNGTGEGCIKCRGRLKVIGPLGSLGNEYVSRVDYVCDGCGQLFHRSYDIPVDSLDYYNDQIEYMNRKQ